MKVILYMGVSINGFIAKLDGDSEWTSDEDLQGFYTQSKNAGNIIMGKNTALTALDYGYFPFPDALNVVMTHHNFENKWGKQVMFTEEEPEDLLKELEDLGYKTAFLAGGGTLNSSFAKSGLIDEIFLDVEPLAFGQGIPLFVDANFEMNLELLEVNKLNPNTVQLHYKVQR